MSKVCPSGYGTYSGGSNCRKEVKNTTYYTGCCNGGGIYIDEANQCRKDATKKNKKYICPTGWTNCYNGGTMCCRAAQTCSKVTTSYSYKNKECPSDSVQDGNKCIKKQTP